jgi:hypothetical protein
MPIIVIQKRLVEDAVSGFWDMFGTSVKSSRLESVYERQEGKENVTP